MGAPDLQQGIEGGGGDILAWLQFAPQVPEATAGRIPVVEEFVEAPCVRGFGLFQIAIVHSRGLPYRPA